MKNRNLLSGICALFCVLAVSAQEAKEWNFEDIYIRDPYILPVKENGTYYLYRSSHLDERRGGVEVFTSKDLKKWYGPKRVFTVPQDNWIIGSVWAPEVHRYKGKYYLFATLNSDIIWKKSKEGWPDFTFRGTQIFYADKPDGPFLPFTTMPHTRMDEMSLDGTLYVEDDIPYMVYCHEWVQLEDGSIDVVRLKDDLSASVGSALRLFYASSAPWATGKKLADSLPIGYITDGCFLHRSVTGKLLMIWSSFCHDQYAIGIAESVTGKITGPWIQQEKTLFDKNGGHGMLFRSFDGTLYIVLHGPNTPNGAERGLLYEVIDTGDSLRLK